MFHETQSGQKVFRFAPSPNGYLHLGHARSAILNHDLAREKGGRFLLRIEDIDLGRARPEYEQAIYEDLGWLGLTWEQPVRRQSEHFGDYQCALERLEEFGLLYPCFCTRSEIAKRIEHLPDWPRDPDGSPLYPGTCRHLSEDERGRRIGAGEFAVRRIHMQRALAAVQSLLGWEEYGEEREPRYVRAEPAIWGDAVVSRKDVPTSYHISVVVDDAAQGVTNVVRGMDLMPATSLHRLLQELLDLPAPAYRHHALVLDEHGQKLSKSSQSTSLRQLRADGATPDDIRRMAGVVGPAEDYARGLVPV